MSDLRGLLLLCLASYVTADLRMASHPRQAYYLTNQGTVPWNLTQPSYLHYRYMEPSTFDYKGLENQKKRNYDNFLRSNIDNEQDNRDFNQEDGKDHLPFRSNETVVFDNHLYHPGNVNRIKQRSRNVSIAKVVHPGESLMVPLRWNNPHSSEMEVNIWIFEHEKKQPIVVPIRKPSCSGEGYQDNIISFTVPSDFKDLGAKIPGFKGCSEYSSPMCTLQIYSHSVESRTYAMGFPIVIPGHNESLTTSDSSGIQKATDDPWLDLSGLRDICLPASDPSATISAAVPRWAKLVSDVYNHAYQNSDYSPYSGQQHEYISKNLQASAINKMEVGNRGELGKSILPRETYSRLRQLQGLENKIYKNYEALANRIIQRLGNQMKTTDKIGAQQLASCFRCKEAGSTNTKRLQTNTYIPSFQLPKSLEAQAKSYVSSTYKALITDSGLVQIYVAALNDLVPFYYKARDLGIIYQDAILKSTTDTMSDATSFKKIDAAGKVDGGKYAAIEAKKQFVADRGCPSQCLYAKSNVASASKVAGLSNEAAKTWSITPHTMLGGSDIKEPKIATLKLNVDPNVWIVGCVDGPLLKMAKVEITGAHTYKSIASRYQETANASSCTSQATFTTDCFSGTDPGGDAYKLTTPPFVPAPGQGMSINAASWFCVASSTGKWVKGPYADLTSAKLELNKTLASRSVRQQICEMSETGAKGDPRSVGGVRQDSRRRTTFQTSWPSGSRDYRAMNDMCNKHDLCRYNGKLPIAARSSWYCVVSATTNFVSGPYADVNSAKKELNKTKASRSVKQMICEMTENGAKRDPSKVGGQHQLPMNGFEASWPRGWGDINHMNKMCNDVDTCRYSGAVPAAKPGTWFCVASATKKSVKGPFSDIKLAKEELNKNKASSSVKQMICEMSAKGAKRDPHKVGGQNQGSGPKNGFQTSWPRGWRDINHMNNMCNANAPCKLNVPADEIAKPLILGSIGTNITGPCSACVQFFGKTVHELERPRPTTLSLKVEKSGIGGMSMDSVPDNPDDEPHTPGRRRRRSQVSI